MHVTSAGELQAVAFTRSQRPPPLRFTGRSLAQASYSLLARKAQTVGSSPKLPQPFSTQAGRNRLAPAYPVAPPEPPVLGGRAVEGAWRTIAAASQRPTSVPMHARLGFTHGAIAGAMQRRLSKPVLG